MTIFKKQKNKSKSLLKLLSTASLSVIVGLPVQATTSHFQQVTQIRNTSGEFLPYVNCLASGPSKHLCLKHQTKAKEHFKRALELAKIADQNESSAKSFHNKANKIIGRNPSLANKFMTESSEKYIASKQAAAAANAHVSAAIAQKKAGLATISYGATFNCKSNNSSDFAACVSSKAKKLSDTVPMTGSKTPARNEGIKRLMKKAAPAVF